MNQTTPKNIVIAAIVGLSIGFVFIGSILKKPSTPATVIDSEAESPTTVLSVCESARNTLFSYNIVNPEIEKYQARRDYDEYVNVKKLKDYFFANGVRKTPGGYSWEMEELERGCKIKILLTDDGEGNANPEWSVLGNFITCLNPSACKLTPELK